MLNDLFNGIYETQSLTMIDFVLCIGVSLLIGVIIALSFMYKTHYTKSFVVTVMLLPAIVCVVIMMVNGNVGAGVAVAGAFSLVRFRSVPGSAKEIATIFFAMAAGLITGMGYLGLAITFTVILSVVFVILYSFDLGIKKNSSIYKTLRIMIPESLDYTGVFDEVFDNYLDKYDLVSVKTTNMGSMYKLTYEVVLKNPLMEKYMIDDLRCRNGNLEITVSKTETVNNEL